MRDFPEIKIDQSTQVIFYHVGLTFYAAHSFEKCLLGMLTGLYVVENLPNWRENYLKESINLNALPLGKLLKKAKNSYSFEPEVVQMLELALEKRNLFIHHYLTDSFGLLSDPRGHKKVIEDLVEFAILFRKADDLIEPISYQLMLKGGMTEKQISMYAKRNAAEQLKANGIQP